MFKKHSTHNRTRIKSVSGSQWLTIPVLHKGQEKQTIHQVKIDPHHHWKQNHLRSLKVCYQNSPYYFFFEQDLHDLLTRRWSHLDPLLFQSTHYLCQKMRVKCDFQKSSELPLVHDRSQRVIAWLKYLDCDTYLFEPFEMQLFDTNKIISFGYGLDQLHFNHPRYHQLFNGFIASLSGLDLLFNEGELSKNILTANK